MKVVKVTKHSRNSIKEFFFVAHPPYGEEIIQEKSEELCERDDAGRSYGYTGEWEFVEEAEIINRVLDREIGKIDKEIEELSDTRSRIEKLESERAELEKFLIPEKKLPVIDYESRKRETNFENGSESEN